MKILAIRGRNLASLADAFSVDFREQPLRDAGVFAICGPTGAGKSTLLDALCLALYDDTPRLTAAGVRGGLPDGADVTLSPKDTAHLLRRGAAEGEAIVEFLGNDGIEYRARWAIRRARGRPDGKLQKVEMSLDRCDDGTRIGHLKTEVLDAIKARIGLDFGQFTRAVLLAQNEFAAFLKAGDDERAALLQTLTGTDTFERISREVFVRSRDETQQLEGLERQRALYPVLSAEERSVLDAAIDDLRQAQVGLQSQRELLDAAARWHAADRTLARDLDAAESDLVAARTALADAVPRQREFARTDAARGARTVVDALDRSSAERDVAERAAVAAATDEEQARTEHATDADAAKRAEETHAAAVAAEAHARPALLSARALDTQLLDRESGRQRAAEALAAARGSDDGASRALEALLSGLATAGEHQATARAWLDEYTFLQVLSESWERWDAELVRAAETAAEVKAAAAQAIQREAALATARAEGEQAGSELAQAEARATAARTADDAAQAVVSALDAAAIAQARKDVEARRELLASAEDALRELDAARERLETVAGERTAAGEDARHWGAELLRIRALIPAADAAAQQAALALRRAELAAAAEVERLRDALVPDEACPVCGSTDHPWRAASPAFDALAAELREDARTCDAALQSLRQEEGAAGVRADDANGRAERAAISLPALNAALETAARTWASLGLDAEVASSQTASPRRWLEEALANNRDARAACASREAALDEAQGSAINAAKARRAAEEELGSARSPFERARARVGELDAEHQARSLAREASEARLAQQLDGLDEALLPLQATQQTSWRDVWMKDAILAHAGWRAQALRWREHRQMETRALDEARALEGRVQGAREVLDQARAMLGNAVAAADAAVAEYERVQALRAALFGGRDTVVVEAELAAALNDAAEAREHAVAVLSHAAQAMSSASSLRQSADQRALRAQQMALADVQQLSAWQAAWPLAEVPVPDIDALRALLRLDEAVLARERDALAAIEAGLRDAAVLRDERRRQRAAHAEARTDARDEAAIAEELVFVTAAQESLGTTLVGKQLQQQADDEHARHGRELSAKITAQHAIAHTWAQLSELVGSANGQKFRNFAQQLTLDVLLAHANAHLHTLARRYRLERGEDSLSLRVVDQDMADERRLVHSLSGGESFLVSLGLALGLASLSSHRVRVESLFIDEGFGSLDPDTLRVAMDALDVLQSQGRKVGVISHVPEMTERIGTRVEVRKQAGGRSVVSVS